MRPQEVTLCETKKDEATTLSKNQRKKITFKMKLEKWKALAQTEILGVFQACFP